MVLRKLVILLIFSCSGLLAESLIVTFDVAEMNAGTIMKYPINGLPVFILKRKPEEITELASIYGESDSAIKNCPKCDPVYRSISKDYLVIWGFNPSSGCELLYAVDKGDGYWKAYKLSGKSALVDPCTKTVFDLSGRRLSGPDSSPTEIEVPVYTYDEGVIRIQKSSYPSHPTDTET